MAPTPECAPRPSRARRRFAAALVALACAGAAAQGNERTFEVAPGDVVRYRIVDGFSGSARPSAEQLLRHLADGDLEGAAVLSNAPRRRYEELAKYRDTVGAEEFKRIYARYFAPANRFVAEIAAGRRHLLVWDLGEADHQLAAQFWVEIDGRYFMDDVPGAERTRLRRVLEAARAGKIRFSD